MTGSKRHDPAYRECFIAFLDILGFRELISRSETDAVMLESLSRLTAVSAQLKAGMKQTDVGPCPMQARSFSDCVVVFTPTRPGNGFARNGLAQLLFLVRFIHDEVLKLKACIRGGVTVGKMYWHPAWTNLADRPHEEAVPALPLTFGPGLVAAYKMESERAKVPRVLIDPSVQKRVNGTAPLDAYPFARAGRLMSQLFREDSDGLLFLDLLHRDVTRSQDEQMRLTDNAFTVEWSSPDSRFKVVKDSVIELARDGARMNAADACVRGKYQWLLEYASAAGTNA